MVSALRHCFQLTFRTGRPESFDFRYVVMEPERIGRVDLVDWTSFMADRCN